MIVNILNHRNTQHKKISKFLSNNYLKPHQSDTTSKFMLLPKRHGQCTSITMLHNMIISIQFRKNAVFEVITNVTENRVKVRHTNM